MAPPPHASPVRRGHCDVFMGRGKDDHPEVLSHLTGAQVTCPQLSDAPRPMQGPETLKSTTVPVRPRMSLEPNSTFK